MTSCASCFEPLYARGLCKRHYRELPDVKASAHLSKTRSRNKNREKTRESYRSWYSRNKDSKKAAALEHVRKHPEQRRALMQRRNARKRAQGGFFTATEWDELQTAYGNRCRFCATTEDITADHVVPVSKGGTSFIWNMQPLCRTCNCRKGDREHVA